MKSSVTLDPSQELDATETAKLKKIVAASGDLEADMKAAHAQCLKAYAARKVARKNSKDATLEALRVAYGTYLAASASKAAKLDFLKVAGLSSSQKTSSLLLNTVIKVAITADRRQASRFAAVIKLAIIGGTTVKNFTVFVKFKGGVTKCVKLYRKATAISTPAPQAAASQIASVEMGYGSPSVEKALTAVFGMAEASAKTLKRQAIIAVSPDGSCKLLEVRGMPKP